jgi:2'-5' RNA ligase
MNYPQGRDAREQQPNAMPEDSARLFTAVWPGAAIRSRLSAERDAWRWPSAAKPVGDAKLHLTLHFIGAFARSRVGALESALAALPPTRPIALHASGREVWRGGIAVLLFAPEPTLAALHAAIGDVLAGLDVALDPRPFAPHVTLARRARGASRPLAAPDLAWRASGFALVESSPDAAEGYRVLRRFADDARVSAAGEDDGGGG